MIEDPLVSRRMRQAMRTPPIHSSRCACASCSPRPAGRSSFSLRDLGRAEQAALGFLSGTLFSAGLHVTGLGPMLLVALGGGQ